MMVHFTPVSFLGLQPYCRIQVHSFRRHELSQSGMFHAFCERIRQRLVCAGPSQLRAAIGRQAIRRQGISHGLSSIGRSLSACPTRCAAQLDCRGREVTDNRSAIPPKFHPWPELANVVLHNEDGVLHVVRT